MKEHDRGVQQFTKTACHWYRRRCTNRAVERNQHGFRGCHCPISQLAQPDPLPRKTTRWPSRTRQAGPSSTATVNSSPTRWSLRFAADRLAGTPAASGLAIAREMPFRPSPEADGGQATMPSLRTRRPATPNTAACQRPPRAPMCTPPAALPMLFAKSISAAWRK